MKLSVIVFGCICALTIGVDSQYLCGKVVSEYTFYTFHNQVAFDTYSATNQALELRGPGRCVHLDDLNGTSGTEIPNLPENCAPCTIPDTPICARVDNYKYKAFISRCRARKWACEAEKSIYEVSEGDCRTVFAATGYITP